MIVGIVVFGMALTAAALAAWPLLRGPAEMPDERAGLAADRERLYAALRTLEFDRETGKVLAEDYAEARRRLEREAADVLRRMDEAKPRAAAPRAARVARPNAATVAAFAALAVALLALGVVIGIALRPAGQASGPQTDPRVEAMIAALEQKVAANPRDVRAILDLAYANMQAKHYAAAIAGYRQALALDPNSAEAYANLGWIEYLGGHVDEGLAMVNKALALDPNNLEALWNKAIILQYGKGDAAAAIPVWERFLRAVPEGEDAARAREMLAEARRKAGGR